MLDYDLPSDELISLGCSDGEMDGVPKYKDMDDEEMSHPTLELGMKFSGPSELKQAIRQANILSGNDIKFLANKPQKVQVACKDVTCHYKLYASWMTSERSFQIKSFQPNHTCPRQLQNHLISSKWLANQYVDMLKDDPEWKVSAIQSSARRDFMANIGKMKAYRAKRKALLQIEGSHKEQYTRLWDYAPILRVKMPGSVVKLEIDNGTFSRFFICLEPIKRGFLDGCRPFIGLDGCHLKGPCGGHLLSAIARDGNNQLFPLAYVVVEQETKDSWVWFLEYLLESIGSVDEFAWAFISDRQEGLVQAFNILMPNVEHRFCARHLYENFKKQFKGVSMKKIFWRAARASTQPQFDAAMECLKKEANGDDAYNWLMKEESGLWSRVGFRSWSKCDLLINNPCESWNKMILDYRDKPIVTMLESIRRKLMTRFQSKRDSMSNYSGSICPTIQSKLEFRKKEVGDAEVLYAGGRKFEVDCKGKVYEVDLALKLCGCREWDLTGIPCKHGIVAIFAINEKPEDYVEACYHISTYRKSYAPIIQPVPDSSQWPIVDVNAILPPNVPTPPGRPKKKRKRAADEAPNPHKLKRHIGQLKCGSCGKYGHNVRTCKGVQLRKKLVVKREPGATRGSSNKEIHAPMTGPSQMRRRSRRGTSQL